MVALQGTYQRGVGTPTTVSRRPRLVVRCCHHHVELSTNQSTVASRDGANIRAAESYEYGDIADVHCRAFYPGIYRMDGFWNSLVRLDRVVALDQGYAMSEQGFPFCCLVCRMSTDKSDGRASSPVADTLFSRIVDMILSRIQERSKEHTKTAHEEDDIVGAVCVDTNMMYIPTQRFTWPAFFNGAVYSLAPRKKMAYISNLAVCPSQRRSGIGSKLVLAAEKLAAEQWNVTCSTLHVDPTNTAAYNLYTRLGYRYVSRQDALTAFFEGRRHDRRLVLMAKKLH